MSVKWIELARQSRDRLMVVLGLILTVVPLALWVAWSNEVFFLVLAICVTSMGLLILLAWVGGAPGRRKLANLRTLFWRNDDQGSAG